MRLYGHGGSYLLLDGKWVVNGNWEVVFDDDENIVNCKEHPRKDFGSIPCIMKVPKEFLKNRSYNHYNEIIDDCRLLLESEKKKDDEGRLASTDTESGRLDGVLRPVD